MILTVPQWGQAAVHTPSHMPPCNECLSWLSVCWSSFADFMWVSEHTNFACIQCGNLASGILKPCLVKASKNWASGLLCECWGWQTSVVQCTGNGRWNLSHRSYTFRPCTIGKRYLVAYLKRTDGFITVYTAQTTENQAINTMPNLLLEKVNVLAASWALNMQQKLN